MDFFSIPFLCFSELLGLLFLSGAEGENGGAENERKRMSLPPLAALHEEMQ